VYLWVDGIHLKVRLEQDKVCLPVMIGVRADGTKELVALADAFRESSESWADLLRDCKRRGMRAPVLAVESAQARWRAVNTPHLVALVRASAKIENGKLIERPDESGGEAQAA
jgi:putative transposase